MPRAGCFASSHMWSPFRKSTSLPQPVRAIFARAFELLDTRILKWRGTTAVLQRRERVFEHNVFEHLDVLDSSPGETPEQPLAIYLATRLGLPLPDSLALDLDLIRPWLRARLVHPRVLEGPARAMCRREAFADEARARGGRAPAEGTEPNTGGSGLLLAVGIGGSRSISFVTTRALDLWGLTFEEVVMIGADNIRRLVSPDDLSEVDGAPGVLALVDSSGEVGASAVLVLDRLIPDASNETGILFSVPGDDACLLLPVRPGAGAASLAAMVQMTYALAAERDLPLSERIFWSRRGRVSSLPMTAVVEGDSRRVHLEASGETEELLRILGELE